MKHLAKRGLLSPMPVAAVFADTRDERQKVYDYLERQRANFPFPITAICKGKLSEAALKVRVSKKSGLTYIKHQIPVFIRRANGKPGMMGRACTMDFKIEPIRRYLRDVIAGTDYLPWRSKHKAALRAFSDAKKAKTPCPDWAWNEMQDDALICLWIGISVDEVDRAKDSVVPWIVNRHPLLEIEYTRQRCLQWLKEEGEEEPPNSSCLYCPYHSDDRWIEMLNEAPDEFEKAAAMEENYQKSFTECKRLDGVPFLHESRIPLRQVKFVAGKQRSVEQTPCKGICGI